MSTTVLVISEDPLNNGYILKPLVERILLECGKPKAKVAVMSDPRPRGYDHAKKLLSGSVLEQYKHFNLLLFLPDADGKNRTEEFRGLEGNAAGKNIRLICCAAAQEVETWLLAGHFDKLKVPWEEVRSEISVKEMYFEPFIKANGDPKAAGQGRERLMNEALGQFTGILQRCPELLELKNKIMGFFNES